MNAIGTLLIDDREYVVIPRSEFERLGGAKARVGRQKERPAAPAVRQIIARTLMRRRIKAGLSQEELARKAGVRAETVCRIESGKFQPRRETMARLDGVLDVN
jgi:ribosome-binding protein aMBF1 (putative translation factor)